MSKKQNNAQALLEAMKLWSPERLALEVRKRKLLTPVPKPFVPQLNQQFPRRVIRYGERRKRP